MAHTHYVSSLTVGHAAVAIEELGQKFASYTKAMLVVFVTITPELESLLITGGMTISSQPAIGGIATEIHYTGFFLRGTDRGCVCAPVDVVPELRAARHNARQGNSV